MVNYFGEWKLLAAAAVAAAGSTSPNVRQHRAQHARLIEIKDHFLSNQCPPSGCSGSVILDQIKPHLIWLNDQASILAPVFMQQLNA